MKGLKIVKSILFVVIFLVLGMGAGVIVSNQLIDSHDKSNVPVSDDSVSTEQMVSVVETEEVIDTELVTSTEPVTRDESTNIIDYIEWSKENTIDMTDYTVDTISDIPDDYWNYKQPVSSDVPIDQYYLDVRIVGVDFGYEEELIRRTNQICLGLRDFLNVESFSAGITDWPFADWEIEDKSYLGLHLDCDELGKWDCCTDGEYVYIKKLEDIKGRRNQ